MKYIIYNPDKINHSVTINAYNDKEALNKFVKIAPELGFYRSEIVKIVREFEEYDFIHIKKLDKS